MRSLFVLALLLSSSAFAAEFVRDPWNYAERDSKGYAEGDMGGHRGWQGCDYAEGSTERRLKIECTGERTVLVFGGHAVTSEFTCGYEFDFVSRAKAYRLAAGDCN